MEKEPPMTKRTSQEFLIGAPNKFSSKQKSGTQIGAVDAANLSHKS